jgi:hypothetical protein
MIKVDEAIRIAKIIEYAPSDRLPLIAEVFTQAGVNINSLQAIAGSDVDDLLDKIGGLTTAMAERMIQLYDQARLANNIQTDEDLAKNSHVTVEL